MQSQDELQNKLHVLTLNTLA